MRALLRHIEFEFKSIGRDKSLLLMSYLFPLAFYFMMAIIMPNINKEFTTTMIPGMIVFTILVSTLLCMPNSMVLYREKGVYRSYKIYGIDAKKILFVPVITTAIHITIVSLIILISSLTIFHASSPQNYLGFILSYLIILFSFLGIGTLLAVCSPNSRITILFAQAIFLPSMMIGGIMMPIEILSKNIQKISYLLPSSHSMKIIKIMGFNNKQLNFPSVNIAILLISGILAFIFSVYLFTWDNSSERKTKKILGIMVFIPYLVGVFIL